MEQSFKSSVYERLLELYETDEFSDVEFHLDDGETSDKIKGHKLLFAIGSPVFKAMWFGSLPENENVTITDVEPVAFKMMKKYLYTDDVQFESVSHATEVYKAADKYDIPHLVKVAEEYITSNVTVNNTLQTLDFVNLHKITEIENVCMNLIKNQTDDVLNSDGLINCSLMTLDKIVSQGELDTSEVNLFNAVEIWENNVSKKLGLTTEKLCSSLSQIVDKIRFLCMTPQEFVNGPSKSKLLSNEEKLKLLEYIVQPGSLEIPRRFSILTTQRNPKNLQRKKKKLQFYTTIENITGDKLNYRYYSPKLYLNDAIWKILAEVVMIDGKQYLSLYFHNDGDEKLDGSNWSFNAKYSAKIKAQKPGCCDKHFSGGPQLFNGRNAWGGKKCVDWSELTDTNKGLINDNKIKVEGEIEVID